MAENARSGAARLLAWAALAAAMIAPVAVAATSPLLASRGAPYVIAGLAGAAGLALLLAQPLLAAGYLPGLRAATERRLHRRVGAGIALAVALHVGGLYVTSPPDALDALLLVSPTPFSVYGVAAMWALIATAALVALRGRLGLRPAAWRIAHNVLAVVIVIGSVVHAMLIEGTMGALSKTVLCGAVLAATAVAVVHLRVLRPMRRRRAQAPGAG
ncbi:ferric reductase-like transmembrane domain-containing protein [Rubrimonas cliftonensis]|uniref:Ferric reductase like transmembrane component n=1 Tax=Rubrimonas cliftonensis TaxID=89524 RepID=A0A1H4D9Y8_9RHOB|nr:ferric reductase-like transmembrane domain-containing protein [Rubrimonas cliftonensis]SEA69316.1 Ferric reductase like transmembrane component [Rubrimonas cliftonensis]